MVWKSCIFIAGIWARVSGILVELIWLKLAKLLTLERNMTVLTLLGNNEVFPWMEQNFHWIERIWYRKCYFNNISDIYSLHVF